MPQLNKKTHWEILERLDVTKLPPLPRRYDTRPLRFEVFHEEERKNARRSGRQKRANAPDRERVSRLIAAGLADGFEVGDAALAWGGMPHSKARWHVCHMRTVGLVVRLRASTRTTPALYALVAEGEAE